MNNLLKLGIKTLISFILFALSIVMPLFILSKLYVGIVLYIIGIVVVLLIIYSVYKPLMEKIMKETNYETLTNKQKKSILSFGFLLYMLIMGYIIFVDINIYMKIILAILIGILIHSSIKTWKKIEGEKK